MTTSGTFVFEFTTGTGTGDLTLVPMTLSATPQYFRNAVDVFGTGSGNKFFYGIRHQSAAEWEIGEGYMSDATTLVRSTVFESSNSNTFVNFSAGTKDVISDIPISMQNMLTQISITAGKTLTVSDNATVEGINTGDQTITISGDASGTGTGAITLTFATVNGNVGTFGSSTSIPTFNVDAKGRILSASGNAVIAPAGTLTGATLAAGVTASSLTSLGVQSQTLDMGGNKISNGLDPTAAQDFATKFYVDMVIQGLSAKVSARLATAAALPTNTYNNGSSGVGATLTGTATGVLTVDGTAVALNDRIVVKNEVTGANNGLYVCTTAGAIGVAYVLTRTEDANISSELNGAFVFVEIGTVNGATGWTIANSSTITIGTTAIVWTQFSGAGTYTAGSGLTLTGNQFSLTNLTGAITSVGSATSLGSFTSAQLLAALTDETGTGAAVFATSPTLVTPLLGTPTSGIFTNCTGLPIVAGTTGTLTEPRGGTNQTTYTLGDTLYASAANTLSKLAGSTSVGPRFLMQTGTGIISAAPVWSQIALNGGGVTGDLPFANLAQGSARSVLGVTGNATADVASIQGTADQTLVVNSAGTALAFGALNLAAAAAVTGALPIANIAAGFLKQDGSTNLTSDWVTGAFDIDFSGNNLQSAGSLTFADNIPADFGAVGQIYSDGSVLIINPLAGDICIGPTGAFTSAAGGAQTGATEDLLVERIGLGGSPINNFYWVNYDLTTSVGRGALNFTQLYQGVGGISTAINSKITYSGSGANPLILGIWSNMIIGADNSGTCVLGARSTIDILSGLVFTQGTRNMSGLEIVASGVGGTHTGGTVRRWGINQLAFTPLVVSGATSVDWGAFFGNDLCTGTDVKTIVEGSQTAKGDSYHVFNSASTDWDFYVDNTKVMTLDNDAVDMNIMLRLVAGTATAGTAPLKMQAGTNLTTPEAGAIEYDGTNFYFTV